MVLEKLNIHMQKNDNRPLPLSYTKKVTQNGSDLKVRAKIIKPIEEKYVNLHERGLHQRTKENELG